MVCIVLAYCVWLLPGATYPAYGDDPSIYLVSAQSLATGHGYHLINDPASPVASYYPIGYPALLATVLWYTPFGLKAIIMARTLSLLMAVGFVLLSWRLLKQYLSDTGALLMALLIGLTPQVFLSSSNIASEWPFALTTLGMIWLIQSSEQNSTKNSTDSWFAPITFVAGVCAASGMLFRTIGFTIVLGIVLSLGIRKQWKKLASFGLGTALIQLPWIIWSKMQGGGTFNGYSQQFLREFSWHTPLDNLRTIVSKIIPTLLLPVTDTQIMITG